MINFLIRIFSLFVRPIEGSSDEWLERDYILDGEVWRDFRCGSVRGLYRSLENRFEILAVQNTKKNKDFDRVLDWFNKSAKRYRVNIVFLEVGNPRLMEKLEALGFVGTEKQMIKYYQYK
jgi:hypothetical protein